MATQKRTLSDADAEIAALRAQLEAAGAAAVDAKPIQRFPTVMYRKSKVTEKTPNGYEHKRVVVVDKDGNIDEAKSDAEVARLEKAGWAHSPEEFAA